MLDRHALVVALVLAGCGAAAPPVADPPSPSPPPPSTAAPPFAHHGALALRSIASTDAVARAGTQAPLYVELEEDGTIVGARCGATRMSDEGVIEREGTPVARVVADDGGFAIVLADGTASGLAIAGDTMTTSGATRSGLAEGRITPSDPELPAVEVVPPETEPTLALALLGLVLVCDDLGP